jgi:hypothetical protein
LFPLLLSRRFESNSITILNFLLHVINIHFAYCAVVLLFIQFTFIHFSILNLSCSPYASNRSHVQITVTWCLISTLWIFLWQHREPEDCFVEGRNSGGSSRINSEFGLTVTETIPTVIEAHQMVLYLDWLIVRPFANS